MEDDLHEDNEGQTFEQSHEQLLRPIKDDGEENIFMKEGFDEIERDVNQRVHITREDEPSEHNKSYVEEQHEIYNEIEDEANRLEIDHQLEQLPYNEDEESVRALTDRKYDEMDEHKEDYLDIDYDPDIERMKDQVVENLDLQVKRMNMQEVIKNIDDKTLREIYIKKFRKEVDFHHKVCYRFEKAYRLGKENNYLSQNLI